MDTMTIVALTYVGVGLLIAAGFCHVMSGGTDYLDDELGRPCESCGDIHDVSEERRDLATMADQMRMAREHPDARLRFAVLAAVLCAVTVVAWPALIGFVAFQRATR